MNTKLRLVSLLTAAIAAPAAFTLPAQAQTAGTVSVSLTSPTVVSGTATASNLTCATGTKAKTYSVQFGTSTVEGYAVTGNASIVGYKGPGNYNAVLTFTAKGPSQTLGGGGRSVPVTITATGGSASFTKTATGKKVAKAAGKTASGSISWTCPTIA
jgi:hypothetical protein